MRLPEQKKQRPASVTFIFLLVLIVGGVNLIRFVQSLRNWQYLNIVVEVPPVYLAISGLFWSIIGIFLLYGIFLKKRWLPLIFKFTIILYVVYFWIEKLVISSNPPSVKDSIFVFGITIFAVVFFYWIITKPNVKEYFGVMNERRSED